MLPTMEISSDQSQLNSLQFSNEKETGGRSLFNLHLLASVAIDELEKLNTQRLCRNSENKLHTSNGPLSHCNNFLGGKNDKSTTSADIIPGAPKKKLVIKIKRSCMENPEEQTLQEPSLEKRNEEKSVLQKRKRISKEEEAINGVPKKRKRRSKDEAATNGVPEKRRDVQKLINYKEPEMPIQLRNWINKMAGGEIIFIFAKSLTSCDIRDYHNRLAIPKNQVSREFLRDEEKDLFGSEGIKAIMIDQDLRTYETYLKKWWMRKNKNYFTYNLINEWKLAVERNGLEVGDIVHLWSFRLHSKLCFAISKVPKCTE